MTEFTVAIVGTGPHPDAAEDHRGYSMGYHHARGYRGADGCRLVACADVVEAHAADFAEEFELPESNVYDDHQELLDAVGPDVVSVCTPPATHLDIVGSCARTDAVRAVHCEKPMAVTWGDCRSMVRVCEENDTRLTVNFQNRCTDTTRAAEALIEDGAIGDLTRIETSWADLAQTGVHMIDLADHFVDDAPVEWVLGQVDYPAEHVWYTDMHSENQALGHWQYETGVHGLIATGPGADLVGCSCRVVGTSGAIEMDVGQPSFRIKRRGAAEWEAVERGYDGAHENAVEHVVESLADGSRPVFDGERALASTEVVFAIWESARRRGRVELPLEVDDNPLEAMVDAGALPPDAPDD